jgi:hypothetical protein
MTQVQTMTNQQINDELRLLLGWTKIGEHPDGHFGCWRTPDGKMWGQLTCGKEPDYCTDAAASLEVQTKAIEVSADKYVSNLDARINTIAMEDNWRNHEIARLLTASPRERAEAAYITLQGARHHEGNGKPSISADA